jgi:hypothetical protein
MLPITTLTVNADDDDLSNQDYRDIYDELRDLDPESPKEAPEYRVSLAKFVDLVKSQYTRAAWSKYHAGELRLNRTMRNELRAAISRPLLPPPIEDTLGIVDPNAEVTRIGEDTPKRVILFGYAGPATLSITKDTIRAHAGVHVTEVTRRNRRPTPRPWVTERQAELREKLGKSWAEIIDAGLEVFAEGIIITTQAPGSGEKS